MKKYIALALFVWSCSRSEEPTQHFSADQQKVLLQEMVTFVYKVPPGATGSTRFLPQFASYYQKSAALFTWDSYHATSDTSGYFLLIRPVGNDETTKRSVGGYFSFDPTTMKIKTFREEFNSPRLPLEEAVKRGRFVFRELSKKGQINHLVDMKHYIEWPDERLRYDLRTHQWVARP